MTKQVIHSRFEYPLLGQTYSEVFAEYRDMSQCNENGITGSGITCSIKSSAPKTVILLTYDRESDTYLKLKLSGVKDLKYRNVLKEALEWEESLKKREVK